MDGCRMNEPRIARPKIPRPKDAYGRFVFYVGISLMAAGIGAALSLYGDVMICDALGIATLGFALVLGGAMRHV